MINPTTVLAQTLCQNRLVQGALRYCQDHPIKVAASVALVGYLALCTAAAVDQSRKNAARQIHIVHDPNAMKAWCEHLNRLQRIVPVSLSSATVLSEVPSLLPEPVVPVRNPKLDQQLHAAALTPDVVACRRLINAGADVNSQDDQGITPLKKAIETGNLKICKLFIDCGAHADAVDREKLMHLLKGQGVKKSCLEIFFVRRPSLGKLQVYFEDRFQDLEEVLAKNAHALDHLPKKIALFNIAEERFSPLYGSVSKIFLPENQETFADLSKHRLVLLGLAEHRNDLLPILDRSNELLPEHVHFDWCLDGHSTPLFTAIGEWEGQFPIHKIDLMRKIISRVSPLGTISLLGCSCAWGHKNFANAWSKYAGLRRVYGSEDPVENYSLHPVYNQAIEGEDLIPLMYSSTRIHVKVYSQGKMLACHELQGNVLPRAFLNSLQSKIVREQATFNAQEISIYPEYFT